MCAQSFVGDRVRNRGVRSPGIGAKAEGDGGRYGENLGESKESKEQVPGFQCNRNHLVWP